MINSNNAHVNSQVSVINNQNNNINSNVSPMNVYNNIQFNNNNFNQSFNNNSKSVNKFVFIGVDGVMVEKDSITTKYIWVSSTVII